MTAPKRTRMTPEQREDWDKLAHIGLVASVLRLLTRKQLKALFDLAETMIGTDK